MMLECEKMKCNPKICRELKTSTARAAATLTATCCRSKMRRGKYTTASRFYQMLFSLQNAFCDGIVNPVGVGNVLFSG